MIIENDHIYNMDCLDGMRDIPSKSIDCVVTDCPYRICSGGVRLLPDGKECGGVLKKPKKVQPTSKPVERLLHNDVSVNPFAMQGKMFANNDIKFYEWLPDVFRVLKEGTHCYIMVNSRNLKELQQASEDVGFEFQNLLVWNKSSCLGGNTQIYIRNTRTGMSYRSNIKDLYRNFNERNKSDWQIMGENGEWKQILNVFDNGTADVVCITLRNGQKIHATEQHRFLTIQGLKNVSELKQGDILQRCTNFKAETKKSYIDYELGFFVGLYLAEGCMEDKNRLYFAINRGRDADLGSLIRKIATRYNAKYSKFCQKDKYCDFHIVCSPIVEGIIEEFISGHNAKTKHLKREVFNADIDFLQGIYEGYLEGDGHREQTSKDNYRWAIGFTYNKELEHDLRLLCDILGHKMHTKVSSTELNGKRFPTIYGHISEYTNHSSSKNAGEIISIVKSAPKRVYDIEVDGNHLYSLVGGVITHNSTPNKYYMQQLEFILMLSKRPARNINDMGQSNLLSCRNIIGNKVHPTQKPVSLMEVLIKNSTNEGDVVLDPFAGCGSTLIAANRLNRRYIGFEIDKQYYDVAYNRLYKEPKEQTLF